MNIHSDVVSARRWTCHQQCFSIDRHFRPSLRSKKRQVAPVRELLTKRLRYRIFVLRVDRVAATRPGPWSMRAMAMFRQLGPRTRNKFQILVVVELVFRNKCPT
jgi:hypothetical protein